MENPVQRTTLHYSYGPSRIPHQDCIYAFTQVWPKPHEIFIQSSSLEVVIILADACLAILAIFSASRVILSSSFIAFFSNFCCSFTEKPPKSDNTSSSSIHLKLLLIAFSIALDSSRFLGVDFFGEHQKQPPFLGGDGDGDFDFFRES